MSVYFDPSAGGHTHHGSESEQYGLDGNDVLNATSDTKSYYLYGGEGSDVLSGYSFADYLEGGRGDDHLYGFGGRDILNGGPGKDSFAFNTALRKDVFATIIDFNPAEDSFTLNFSIFSKLAGGFLRKKAFYEGKKAHDKNDRIIYNDSNGKVSYDSDGKGGAKQIVFAKIGTNLSVSNDDFFVLV